MVSRSMTPIHRPSSSTSTDAGPTHSGARLTTGSYSISRASTRIEVFSTSGTEMFNGIVRLPGMTLAPSMTSCRAWTSPSEASMVISSLR